jgi:hypothetical protein
MAYDQQLADAISELAETQKKLDSARAAFEKIIEWEESMEAGDSAVCKIARKWLDAEQGEGE